MDKIIGESVAMCILMIYRYVYLSIILVITLKMIVGHKNVNSINIKKSDN